MKLKNIFESIINEDRIDTSDFQPLKSLGGSTGAHLYADSKGRKWVVKFGNHVDHMYNEYLSNRMYAKFGIKVPKSFIGEIDGAPCFVSEYLEGSIPIGSDLNDKIKNKAAKGFIFDALFANYDVAGIDQPLDNMRIWNGEVYRVDVGGALLYRGQGRDKDLTDEPDEIDTMRGWRNPQAAKVFSKVTDSGIQKVINQTMKKFVIDGGIDWNKYKEWISSTVNHSDIGLSPEKRGEVITKLLIRTQNLYKRFN